MSLPRARKIVSRTSGLSAAKLLLAAGRQTRPWIRPTADALLDWWSVDGRIYIRYSLFGARRVAFMRRSHLDSDFQSALELAVCDCYRLDRLPDAELVIDGGANTGMFSLAATARWPDARIIAFEPVPHNIETIRSHIALNHLEGRIDVRMAALSGGPGVMKFYEREANQGSFDPSLPWKAEIDVRMESLRDAIRETGAKSVVVKLDIEGAEREVLPDFFSDPPVGDVTFVMELHDVQRNRPLVEALARDHDLELEFFELGHATGHCQISSRPARRTFANGAAPG